MILESPVAQNENRTPTNTFQYSQQCGATSHTFNDDTNTCIYILATMWCNFTHIQR